MALCVSTRKVAGSTSTQSRTNVGCPVVLASAACDLNNLSAIGIASSYNALDRRTFLGRRAVAFIQAVKGIVKRAALSHELLVR